MKPKKDDTLREAREKLKAYDKEHGKWNVDRHRYEKGLNNGKTSA